MIKEDFKKALYEIMTTEIDEMIDYTKGKEQKWLKEFKDEFNELFKTEEKLMEFSYIPLLHDIESVTLLKEIICFMIMEDIEESKKKEESK